MRGSMIKFKTLRPRSDRYYWALVQAANERLEYRIEADYISDQQQLGFFGRFLKDQTRIENITAIATVNIWIVILLSYVLDMYHFTRL
jgi:hypothetical protein